MNKILSLHGNKGFEVSPTLNACTKGIWIWSKPVYNEKENLNIFFIDTEGLDSMDRTGDTDTKLFTLSVLLSSYFIFNSTGSIGEDQVNALALITKLVKTIAVEEGQ